MPAGSIGLKAVFTAEDRISAVVRRIEGQVNGFTDRVSAGFQKIGMATAAVGLAGGALTKQVMSLGMSFEKTLLDAGNKFEPGIKKSSALFTQLGTAAKDVGGATEFSSSQAAVALNDLAGAGFNANQAIAGLPKVVDFATAASLDLGLASEVATKALGAYGMKSDDPKILADNLQRVTDVLMKTDALSSTNISSIFEAFKEGGPVAKSAGLSLETFSAGIGVLGTAGIEGSNAGTTLKNVVLSLAAPTTEAAAAFARFGIKTKDIAGNLRDPIAVLEELGLKTSKLGTADKSAAIEGIFGKIPLAGVNVMLDKIGDLKSQRDELVKSGGQVQLVATSKRAGGTSSWDNFTSGIEAMGLKAFDVIGPDMTKGIELATEAVGRLADAAMPFLREFTVGLKAGFAEAWPAISGAVGILFKGFGGNQQWLGTVKGLATTLGQVAAAAVGVATVMGGMLAAGLQIAGALVDEVTGAWDGMIAGIGKVVFAVDDFFANVGAKWRAFSFKDWGLSLIKGIGDGIASGAGYVYDTVRDLGIGMLNSLTGALGLGDVIDVPVGMPALDEPARPSRWDDGGIPQIGGQPQYAAAFGIGPAALPAPRGGMPPRGYATDFGVAPVPYTSGYAPPGMAPPVAAAPPATQQRTSPEELRAMVAQELTVKVVAEPGTSAEVVKKPSKGGVVLPPSGGFFD